MVNTYAKEMSGQVDRRNHQMHCKGDECEVILGDGTHRYYKKVKSFPSLLLGEELISTLAARLHSPEYFHLIQETLPSGNHLFFKYNPQGRISKIEMKNNTQEKTLSWICFTYELNAQECLVKIITSDDKNLIYTFTLYHLADGSSLYALTNVSGSHQIPCSYQYELTANQCHLIKKIISSDRFIEIDYDSESKVRFIKDPHPITAKPEILYSFSYKNGSTYVRDVTGLKTKFEFNDRYQLTAVEKYDSEDNLYRVDQKYWSEDRDNTGRLVAKTISDHQGTFRSYCSYTYDNNGNVIEKKVFGNFSGKEDANFILDANFQLINPEKYECYKTTQIYSSDGFNLLQSIGDSSASETLYFYKPGTSLCIAELSSTGGSINKRLIKEYDEDASCIKTIEDDGSSIDLKSLSQVSKQYISIIHPNKTLPGVGLPIQIEHKVYDRYNYKELLERKTFNIFDSQGKLIRSDFYDANNQYSSSVEKTYNHLGLIVSETDRLGHHNFYTYDNYGNVASISTSKDKKIIQHFYDYKNQLIKTIETNGEQEFVTENSYDIRGRKISTKDQFGNSTNFVYDDFGRLIQIIFPHVYNENKQVIQPTFSYSYDIFGNVISETDPYGYTTKKVFNLWGKPTQILYPDGTSEKFKYHSRGTLHRAISRDNLLTIYEYDDQGRVLCKNKTTFENNQPGSGVANHRYRYSVFHCEESVDGSLITRYKRDSFGRPILIKTFAKGGENDPNKQITELSYDALGRISEKKSWFDTGTSDYSVEHFKYDLEGKVLENLIVNASGDILLKKWFSYDSQGRCLEEYSMVDGKKHVVKKITYNSFGDPIGYTDASGNQTHIYTDYEFTNSLGQKVPKKTIVNPLGICTEIEFDALGRMACIQKKDMMGVLLSRESLFYDGCGNKCCEIQEQILDGNKLTEQISRYSFGPMGRVNEEIIGCGTFNEQRTIYNYNTLGQICSKIVPGFSSPLMFEYNPIGNLQTVKYSEGKKSGNQEIFNTYSYNINGKITKARNKICGTSVDRTYNSFDQMTSEEFWVDGKRYDLKYTYDLKGRIKKVVLPDNSSIVYVYDAIFCREIKRLSPQREVLYTHKYCDYDTSGKLLCETLIGNAGKRNYQYDVNGNLAQISLPQLNILEEAKYDDLSRIISLNHQFASHSSKLEFIYNGLSQLTSEKNANNKNFVYDSLDNRHSFNEDNLTYNALNQLQSSSKAQYSYDPQGNLCKKNANQQITNYESNILSEIVQIENPDKTKLVFHYDPLGRRVAKQQLSESGKKVLKSEFYFYLNEQEIGIIGDRKKILELRIPGMLGDQVSAKSVGIELNQKVYATVHSIDNQLIALVDPSSSSIAESYSYSPFGEEIIYNSMGVASANSTLKNPWRYAEKRMDSETGLVFFGRRYYDPEIGRWISPDPLGKFDGPNPYAYVHNNPINNYDRFGLSTESYAPSGDYFYGDWEYIITCTGEYPNQYCIGVGHNVYDKGNSYHLPLIRYNDHFEKMHTFYDSEEDFWGKQGLYHDFRPYYERSQTYDLGLPNQENLGIGFINGIDNIFKNSHDSTSYISRLGKGINVHAVYNATHGLTADLYECKMGLNFIATEPVRQLHKMWNNFFSRSSADAIFLMICHSQGAIHTRNALLDYPEHLRNRIIVVAIAPGAYIYPETCAQVIHYRVARDIVPRFDQKGMKRSKNTIVELESHPDAPWFDHPFDSPSYLKKLQDHINEYIITNGRNI